MSNLASLAAIAQGGAALADAGQAYSQYTGTLAQSKYQASVLNQNAQIAAMQGEQATKAGAFQAAMRGLQAGQEIGKARVSGGDINVNTGSAAKVQADIAAASGVDQANIINNAALQRWGYGIEAANLQGQARMAKIGGRFAANSSLISGGMRFARDAGAGAYYYKLGQGGPSVPYESPMNSNWRSGGLD